MNNLPANKPKLQLESKPKPRLSMKLLWAMLVEYQDKHDNPSIAGAFLKWVEEQMKPLKP